MLPVIEIQNDAQQNDRNRSTREHMLYAHQFLSRKGCRDQNRSADKRDCQCTANCVTRRMRVRLTRQR